MADRIRKDRFEPAYAQLATILRRQIAEGVYPQGTKIPSETSMGKKYGLATRTVRQAIGVLTDQGLLERVQGSGTFVKPLNLSESRFGLDSLREIFHDPQKTQVKVLQISLIKADPKTAEILQLAQNARTILIRRLLLRAGRPIMFHEGHIRCDPRKPVVEAELDLGPLCDLFNGQHGGNAKKGDIAVVPVVLSREHAELLDQPIGAPAFSLEYVVYDFDDVPFGRGRFSIPPDVMRLETRLGLWEEW